MDSAKIILEKYEEYFNHAVDKGQIKVAEVICDNCSVYFYDETIEKILYQSNNEKIFNFLIKSSLITGRYEIDIDIDRVDESKKNKLYNNVCLALAFFRSCIKRRKVYDYLKFRTHTAFTLDEMINELNEMFSDFNACDLNNLCECKKIPDKSQVYMSTDKKTDFNILSITMSTKLKKIFMFNTFYKCFIITNKNYK